jgi:hypothetical protein
MTLCFVADLGGLAMVDDGVNTVALATLVCAVRRRLDAERQPLIAYLQPELARDCYRNASILPIMELDAVDLIGEELQAIYTACADIVVTIPAWKPYFGIPIRWCRLLSNMSSSSNPVIPQHIFIGERGLRSARLPEYIVHEISHTWVGMAAEVAPLALCDEPIHVLPSGTPNKTVGQVIYALTFAATAVRFYRARIAADRRVQGEIDRLRWLEDYTAGCLRIVDSSDKLLPNGAFMAESCRRFLYS